MSPIPKLRRHAILPAILVSLAGAAGAGAAVEGPRIQLTFVPQENVGAPVAAISPAMRTTPIAVAVEDGRTVAARDVVGTVRREGVDANIRAANDVVVYALGALVQTAGQWGLQVVQGTAGAEGHGPGRLLTVRLTRFRVDETVRTVGSTYSAQVDALFRLTDGGRLVYEGVGAGTARRYGKSENEENYSEVLSDALKEAFAKGFSDPGLQNAWTAGPRALEPPAPHGMPAEPGPSGSSGSSGSARGPPPRPARRGSRRAISWPISRSCSARASRPISWSTTSTSGPSPPR